MSERLDQAPSGPGPVAARAPGLAAVLVVALALAPARADAATRSGRVVFLPLQGPAAEQLERILVQVFPPELNLVPLAEVDRALVQAGAVLPVTAAQHATLARKLQATAIIGGRSAGGPGWRLRLVTRDAATGAPLAARDITGRSRRDLAVNVRRQAPGFLRDSLASAPPRSPPTAAAKPKALVPLDPGPPPGRDPDPPARDPDPPARPPSGRTPEAQVTAAPSRAPVPEALLELSVGPRVMSRSFIYTDNLAGLPGYTLPAALGAFAEAEIYPAARSGSAAANFGLAGMWEASMGAKTVGRDGAGSNLTRGKSYRAGVRFRLKSERSAITLGADYGEHSFDLTIDDVIPPNVVYDLFRPSVAGRLGLGRVSLGLTAAYLHVLSVGGLGDRDRFPRIRARGAEVAALAGLALDRDFELRVMADLRHYAHHMHVKPGDPLIVGGAIDEHFGAALLINYRLR